MLYTVQTETRAAAAVAATAWRGEVLP